MRRVFQAMPWPAPALVTWALGWAVFAALTALIGVPAIAWAAALVTTAVCAMTGRTVWRKLFMAAGFPLSSLALGNGSGLPAGLWLAGLAALWLLYPLRAWADAPLFPTPSGSLAGIDRHLKLRASPGILDAGCGLGSGLIEWAREYPAARCTGLEWSWLIALMCWLRCLRMLPQARIRRADMWRASWAGFDVVYVFQRPESMEKIASKARAELGSGAWLVSLEFPVPSWQATHVMRPARGRCVWLYQMP